MKGYIFCEICNTKLIARKGEIKIHHYAHKTSERKCDSWNKPLTEWHLKWQNFFKINNYGILEYVIQKDNIKHRTDIYTNKHYCIEIQHSNINHDDIISRENFYGEKMFWIVDGTIDKFQFYFKTQNNYFVGKFNKDYIQSCNRTVYIDTDYGLFELIKYIDNKICIIKRLNNIFTDTKNLYKCFKNNERINNNIHKQLFDYMNYNTKLYIKYYCDKYDEILDIFTNTKYIFYKYLKNIGYVQYLNCSYYESLNYVDIQTEEICLEAIKQDCNNYNFVKNKSYEFNLLAIKQDGSILNFIDKNKDNTKLYLESVKYNGLNLQYIESSFQTEEICLEAFKQNINAFKYIKNKTQKMCIEAVKYDSFNLQYIESLFQTEEICLEAFKQNKDAFKYIKNKNKSICLEAVKYNGLNLQYIESSLQTEEIYLEAIKQNKYANKYFIPLFQSIKQNNYINNNSIIKKNNFNKLKKNNIKNKIKSDNIMQLYLDLRNDIDNNY